MSVAQIRQKKLVLGLAGIILFLLALIVPYPLYKSYPEYCPESIVKDPGWCIGAHKAWEWQQPLILQIYQMIEM
jgi:hypothetical protein